MPAPVANDGTATVAANSTGNAITLGLSGGSTESVAVSSAPGYGTATASGTTIPYTPTAGYSGPDSFTYTASNATGTSAPATVTITVTPPTLALTPEAGALPAGTVGTAYSQTTVASDGTAPAPEWTGRWGNSSAEWQNQPGVGAELDVLGVHVAAHGERLALVVRNADAHGHASAVGERKIVACIVAEGRRVESHARRRVARSARNTPVLISRRSNSRFQMTKILSRQKCNS